MSRAALSLSLIAVAALAGCATYDRATPASTPVVVASPPPAAAPTMVVPPATIWRAGSGRIESISAVPATSASAAAGATTATRRIGIKMADGTVQFVDTSAAYLAVGDRVELTSDGYLKH